MSSEFPPSADQPRPTSASPDSAAEADISIKPRRKPPDDADMDITPMIDITFLLLIFFLVTSTMQAASEVALPKAEHGNLVDIEESVVITIADGVNGGRVRVFKGDTTSPEQQLGSDDLADQEEELIAYIEENLVGKKRYVVIKASGGVKHREVARIEEAAAKVVEVESLFVAVKEEG